ncbi:hypothetical protein [Actinomyces faecalis]|uniref:hypothetical protein n=1 Tax=Actinomyces faecalis TaxID=2722820 RepID=UPI0015531F01|nr:hypothetical protein [Actinomyces faecalis]
MQPSRRRTPGYSTRSARRRIVITETLIVRPAHDIKSGDRIRAHGQTETVTAITSTPSGTRRIFTDVKGDYPYTTKDDYTVDVVTDTTEPGPEKPACSIAPLIRISKSADWKGDSIPSGTLALRDPAGGYVSEDDHFCFSRDHGDEITEREDLTPVRTDLIRDLRKAKEETDADPDVARPFFLHLAAARVASAAARRDSSA